MQDKEQHEVFSISDGAVACPKPAYRSYPERWWLLLTVVLLNLANYSHWVAFPSVTKESALLCHKYVFGKSIVFCLTDDGAVLQPAG